MIRKIEKIFFIFFIFLVFTSCSSVPRNVQNSCALFSEKYLWYKHAKKVEEKWGVPIYIQIAFIKQESNFSWLAKPKRLKIFKIIPYKRPSSSFGYSQAIKSSWKLYKKETNNNLALRTRFKDSVDFIGWYINKTQKILKIPKKDAYRQYIAYHEGWGNYKNYRNNKKVIILATNVKKQSTLYKKQLTQCQNKLNKKKYIIF